MFNEHTELAAGFDFGNVTLWALATLCTKLL
jgi:hypothetical protein